MPEAPLIEIVEPTQWADGPRTLVTSPNASIPIRGTARHPEGIRTVVANGLRLGLVADGDPATVHFSGFVAPPRAGQSADVELMVVARNGAVAIRRFPLRSADEPLEPIGPIEPPVVDGSGIRRRAIVIGVGDYQSDEIPDLEYAEADAQAFHRFLTSAAAGLGGFADQDITLLTGSDATAASIRSALSVLARDPAAEDLLYLFMVAHGMPDPERPDDFYILPYEARPFDLPTTAIRLEEFRDALLAAGARHTIVLADVSRHGSGPGGPRARLRGNPINSALLDRLESKRASFVVLTAGQNNQVSREGEQWGGGHGVFTHHLLEALSGAADDDGDGIVTLREMLEYTRDRVGRATHNAQIPAISFTSYDGYLPLAERIRP